MLYLWQQHETGLKFQSVDGPEPLFDESAETPPSLSPLTAPRGAIAALIVPDRWDGAVAQNGVPLAAGLHLIGHADRLDAAGRTFWLAVSTELSSELYRPEQHGEDVFCFITKARLQPGDEIVVCPGRPGSPCGIMYKRQAWEMAREASSHFRCPQCGFDPAAGRWEPTVRTRGSLDQLFALANQHMGKG